VTQPIITDASERKRPFACSAVAVQAIIVNEQEQVLLLASPHRYAGEKWQVVSGALEGGETILEGALRETREEAGEAVRVRPLGVVHAQTFHYDTAVQYAIGIYYLFAYEGGNVEPGDDMKGSLYRWWSVEELERDGVRLHVSTHLWILCRAVELYRLWVGQVAPLQPAL
jgi:ADP-ribose pyrophosphatase YjhB (NUDIX family)